MTARKGPAVLIHLDVDGDLLHLSTLSPEAVCQLEAEPLGHGIAMATFRSLAPDEAERRLGAGLFALLDSLSGGEAGVRDYAGLRDASTTCMASALRRKALAGDPDAQYDLHHLLFSEAAEQRTAAHLAEAEHFLRLAAASGHVRAADELLQWPLLKKSIERRARDEDA